MFSGNSQIQRAMHWFAWPNCRGSTFASSEESFVRSKIKFSLYFVLVLSMTGEAFTAENITNLQRKKTCAFFLFWGIHFSNSIAMEYKQTQYNEVRFQWFWKRQCNRIILHIKAADFSSIIWNGNRTVRNWGRIFYDSRSAIITKRSDGLSGRS